MQVLALLPGFSRTGSTIAGGLMVGLAHEDALRFSFLLATPIIGAAAALKLPVLLASRDAPAIELALVGASLCRSRVVRVREVIDQVFQVENAYPIRCILFPRGIDQLVALPPTLAKYGHPPAIQVSVQRGKCVEKGAPESAARSSLTNSRAACRRLGNWSFRSQRHAATIASIRTRHWRSSC